MTDTAAGPARTALFVDFDNIYLGLQKLDPDAAQAFANDPARWLTWLEEGADRAGGPTRRLLIRNVYLNPAAFGNYRAIYTRAGFRAIDCPPLTAQGKNSADIYMVLDIVDALQGPFAYDEFVIASADADFTPVLHRLRARDRRTTLLTAGLSAAAYRAVCDTYIGADVLAAAALGEVDDHPDHTAAAPAPVLVAPTQAAKATAAARSSSPADAEREAVRAAVVAAVRESDRPIVSAAAAHAALKVDPNLKATAWWGAGSFRAFLALYVEEVVYDPNPTPGYVYDPQRHTADDIPHRDDAATALPPLLAQVCSITGAPPLTSERYAILFNSLRDELAVQPFHRNETSKRVRDRTDLRDASVGRNAVTFVVNGLLYGGVPLTADTTPEQFAQGWADKVLDLCANAQFVLAADDESAVRRWITSGLG